VTMPRLAFVVYVLGLALAFGMRTAVQWRRTGDTGLRLAAGPVGSPGWWSKMVLIVALVWGLAGLLAGLAGLDPIGLLDHSAVGICGFVLAGAGLVATLLAQLNMGPSWRIGVDTSERTALVTGGAFAVVRNPIFSGMAATSLGLAFMVPNLVSLTATVVLFVAIQLQVRAVEEPYLRRVHGTAYATYAARVGRFLPGVGLDPRARGS
jgi:protein-S-isoprenylcysteine O-methyltransferase Ste14